MIWLTIGASILFIMFLIKIIVNTVKSGQSIQIFGSILYLIVGCAMGIIYHPEGSWMIGVWAIGLFLLAYLYLRFQFDLVQYGEF